jgi:general secretion pathway protein A
MYEEYYGFTERPFSLTPDPKYLYKSESHANAFELLRYAVRRREGFVVVTGDIGTGKTTLCRALLEEIDRHTFSALVLNPFLSEEDLLKSILQDFGVISRDDVKRGRLTHVSKQELIETIYDFLLTLLPLGASALLIVDEAQNLPMPVLEQIRILSNLETDKEKLLQIVLVGQLNLQPLLKAPQMRQLDQRVSIRYQLRPLSRDEVAAYVSHRMKVAGASASVVFQPKAIDMVHRRTKGIPRLVNLVCERALLAAYSSRVNRVSADIVYNAAETLDLVDENPSRFAWVNRRASMYVAAAGASVSLAVAGSMVALRTPPDAEGASAALVAAESRVDADAAASAASTPPARYSVLTASFPIADLLREGSAAALQFEAVVGELRGLGYDVRSMDVNLKDRGEWRRVLVGEFATASDAKAEAHRVHRTAGYADAQVIRY